MKCILHFYFVDRYPDDIKSVAKTLKDFSNGSIKYHQSTHVVQNAEEIQRDHKR